MTRASTQIGILLFDDVEELDFAGPWEVFSAAAAIDDSLRVTSVAATAGVVRCAKGLRVLPEHAFADAPPLGVVVVPGGRGTRRLVEHAATMAWLRDVGARCAWVTSVCTGALVLHAAGFARGKRVTTHWSLVETLRALGDVVVLEHVRYVRDGNVVTAAGVSAGIDMALWLVGQLRTPDLSREVRRHIEYSPAPPYLAEV
jgi:transcriptional regulator GlxA family with amidase domain